MQIGSNLRPSEYDGFKSYALGLQLTHSAVANLLVLRELRRKRLGKLREKILEHRGLPRHRITANVSPPIKAAFEAHLKTLGLGSDVAAGIIFRAELCERWLDRAIGTTNQIDSRESSR